MAVRHQPGTSGASGERGERDHRRNRGKPRGMERVRVGRVEKSGPPVGGVESSRLRVRSVEDSTPRGGDGVRMRRERVRRKVSVRQRDAGASGNRS